MSENTLVDYVRQAEVAEAYAAKINRQYACLKSITPWLGFCWAGAFAGAILAQSHWVIWCAAGFIVLFATLGLTFLQRRWCRLGYYQRQVAAVSRDRAARINRQWSDSFSQFELQDGDAWLARDLDLLGHASLFELVCTAHSSLGIETLKNWFLNPADGDEIRQRQQAVQELSQRNSFLQAAQVNQRQHLGDSSALEDLLAWACREPVLERSRFLSWATIVLPLVVGCSAVASFAGWVPLSTGLPVMLATIACNTLITLLFISPVHDVFHNLLPTPTSTRLSIASLFQGLAAMTVQSGQLTAIRASAEDASQKLKRLQWLMQPTLLSRSPWTVIWFYLPLQFVALWDFHWLRLIEKWQKENRAAFGKWVESFAKFEALASLATLACDHPDWQYPTVSRSSGRIFEATGLGHPLLPDRSRVTNDVSIGPVGTMLLITGSNMSGKSTMLRAIGLNAVLAQTGGPVCATGLTLSPLNVVTSIRVVDSLQSGVSLFMAEVKRLKRVIELARQTEETDPTTMLFLFDEVLQGTNTAERHVALRRVLSYLLQHRVIGAITTHDLQLAEEPAIVDRSQLVHFRDTLQTCEGKTAMIFDYQMRPGIAPTTNALALLDLVGLGEQDVDGSDS